MEIAVNLLTLGAEDGDSEEEGGVAVGGAPRRGERGGACGAVRPKAAGVSEPSDWRDGGEREEGGEREGEKPGKRVYCVVKVRRCSVHVHQNLYDIGHSERGQPLYKGRYHKVLIPLFVPVVQGELFRF